jgi:hypothetical protein
MEIKTYWKVQVEEYADGTVKAAVIEKREAVEKPPGKSRTSPGMMATVQWFDSREEADRFVSWVKK